jgi:hypothetical protein
LQRTIGNQAVQRMFQTHAEEPDARSTAATSPRLAHDFSQIPVHAPAAGVIQAKLTINTPGDIYEHEPDRVPEQVVRMPEPRLQLTCACGGACPNCQTGKPGHEHERFQMTYVGPGVRGPATAPSSVHEVLHSPGQPLDVGTPTFMEPRFGHDFSRVRIHTDAEAAQSAGQLQASAYTLGDHVVFAEGQFAPSTSEGGRLLAHELAHVVQGAGQNAILRRKPDPKLSEAQLRVQIVDALVAIKTRAFDAVVSAVERGDRAYLQGLQLTSKQVDDLLNHTSRFNTEFGTALERQIEQYVRANPDLGKYVKKGPHPAPRGVGKPDWIIETPSSRIAVELTTPKQLEKKLKMWRSQHPKGKPKWYVEKSLNLTYDIPPGRGSLTPSPAGPSVEATGAATQEIAQVATKASRFRTAGRFLVREAPGLALQALVMVLFPPSVNIHNDKADELSRTKLDPAVWDALAKQEPVFDKLMDADISKSIYANVTARLYYSVDASQHGDLEVSLKDITLLEAKITNEDISLSDPKFNQTGSSNVSKQITYSLLLYEPEYVSRDREWARKQQEYQECLQRYGTSRIPPAAGAEAASQFNPEEGACIPPRMEPMEEP